MISGRKISRRRLLGGAGAVLGAPLFRTRRRARAASASPPRRLVFFVIPYGTPETPAGYSDIGSAGCFRPSAEGAGYTLTSMLEPLADLREEFSILTGLHNNAAMQMPGYVCNDHPSLTQGLLTAVGAVYPEADPPSCNGLTFDGKVTGKRQPLAATSVDQMAANYLKTSAPTPVSSLEMGTFIKGYPADWYSWSDPSTPVSKISEPQDAWTRLWGGGSNRDPKRDRRSLDILEYARADFTRLQKQLGKADGNRLGQYLKSVEGLEQRIKNQATLVSAQCAPMAAPGAYADVREKAKLMLDLIPLAFQCDRTRIVTFNLGGYDDDKFPFLGAPYSNLAHHGDMSHSLGDAEKVQGYLLITKWKMSVYAYLLRKLKDTPDVDGQSSLLDNTTVVLLSEMGYGGHDPRALPVLLGGRGGGDLHPGRHLVVGDIGAGSVASSTPVANLYVTLLSNIGLEVQKFGNSTGRLTGL